MSRGNRRDQEPAFVLHSYAWRETSLLLEVFSRNHGRLAMVARGARRPHSAHRGLLLAFRPLRLSWFGKGEVRTLHAVELAGVLPGMAGLALMCGFYINELILKLLPRDAPHEGLFDLYSETLATLAGGGDFDVILRRFEKGLMREMGYALQLTQDAEGEPIRKDAYYRYLADAGPRRCPSSQDDCYSGEILLDLAVDDYSRPETMAQAKRLTRNLLHHHLGGEILRTRQLLRELHRL